jgi:periplasmic divalent cation tolerance protein
MSDEIVLYVTVPNGEEAQHIAESLVSERLAACVNIIDGIRSVYWWQGEVHRDSELLMIIKSTKERYEALEERIKQLHSYSTPEVIALSIECGSSDYLKWLRASTTPEA